MKSGNSVVFFILCFILCHSNCNSLYLITVTHVHSYACFVPRTDKSSWAGFNFNPKVHFVAHYRCTLVLCLMSAQCDSQSLWWKTNTMPLPNDSSQDESNWFHLTAPFIQNSEMHLIMFKPCVWLFELQHLLLNIFY